MTKSEVLLSILAGFKISTDDLKRYGVDLEQVSSICFLSDYLTISPLSREIDHIERRVPLLGVNPDYFNQYLMVLEKNDIGYQLSKKPYRHVVLNGIKFKIRDDRSYADSLKSERKPLGLEDLIVL